MSRRSATRKIVTRFPPEPNGYLHIGHAKSICLNFGIARENRRQCNLRMDDTNPAKEDVEYVDSITADVRWLIAGWADHCLGFKPKGATAAASASQRQARLLPCRPSLVDARPPTPRTPSPFSPATTSSQLYEYAVELIKKGKAYVCDLTPEETDEYRGAPDKPGKDSPLRNRSVAENLDLFHADEGGRISRTAPAACARRSTWRRPTSGCAIRCSTASATPRIITPATSGASIRSTISRIA